MEDHDWLKRLTDEYWELGERIMKLTKFLDTTATFSMTGEKRSLLRQQLDVMMKYRKILAKRIVLELQDS